MGTLNFEIFRIFPNMKLTLSVNAILVAGDLIPYQANKAELCTVEGISMVASDGAKVIEGVETVSECWEICVKNENCRNWTWKAKQDIQSVSFFRPATCTLVESEVAPVLSVDANAISGAMFCQDIAGKMWPCGMIDTVVTNSDVIAGNVRTKQPAISLLPAAYDSPYNTLTAQHCQQLCNLLSDCALYTWYHETAECRIKNSGGMAYAYPGQMSGSNLC